MLIALEGVDGAGKGTQLELVSGLLRQAGLTIEVISFPRYRQGLFGDSVARFLNGGFGDPGAVPPHFPALLFACDRLEHRRELLEQLQRADVVLADRYVASNAAYQAARLEGEERAAFLTWLLRVEYDVFELPQPALQVYLRVEVGTAQRLVAGKNSAPTPRSGTTCSRTTPACSERSPKSTRTSWRRPSADRGRRSTSPMRRGLRSRPRRSPRRSASGSWDSSSREGRTTRRRKLRPTSFGILVRPPDTRSSGRTPGCQEEDPMSDSPPSHQDWRDEIEESFMRARPEQRRQSRSNCNIPALVAIEGDEHRRKAVVRNLSAIGAFLETDPIPVGTRLKLVLANAAMRTAEVVWLEDPGPSAKMRTIRGVGVRFLTLAQGTQP